MKTSQSIILSRIGVAALLAITALPACSQKPAAKPEVYDNKQNPIVKVVKTEGEWRKILTPNVFEVTRKAATEPPFKNEYWNNHAAGTYRCADCNLDLFSSKTKFESGTGWPSFWQPLEPRLITKHSDHELGYERIEVRCARCGAHLGHVFDDGPRPTGLRYCMNSAALKFVKESKEAKAASTGGK